MQFSNSLPPFTPPFHHAPAPPAALNAACNNGRAASQAAASAMAGVAKKIADERKMNNSKNKMDDKLITYLIDIWYRSSIHILLTSIWMTYLIDIEYRCGDRYLIDNPIIMYISIYVLWLNHVG